MMSGWRVQCVFASHLPASAPDLRDKKMQFWMFDMRMLILTAILPLTFATAAFVPQQALANDAAPLVASCLCRDMSGQDRYFARFANDAESSQKLKDLIEANTFGLRKNITIRGDGCGRDNRLTGLNASCGQTSVVNRDRTGKVTSQATVDNTEFSGEITLRITYNSGIPRIPGTPDDQPKVDMEQWNSGRVTAIQVGGVALKVTPK